MAVIVIGMLCAALIVAVIWKQNRRDETHLAMLAVAAAHVRGAMIDPEPDLNFAAKGYLQVAVVRRYGKDIDLHHLERAHAEELLKDGCTREQALSARWGGAYAIADDLSNFDNAIAAYRETAEEMNRKISGNTEETRRMMQAAALLVISTVHATDKKEYGRFLYYIGEPI